MTTYVVQQPSHAHGQTTHVVVQQPAHASNATYATYATTTSSPYGANGYYIEEPYVGPVSIVLGICLLGFLCPLVFLCPCDSRTTFVPTAPAGPQVTYVAVAPQAQHMASDEPPPQRREEENPKIVQGTPTTYYPNV